MKKLIAITIVLSLALIVVPSCKNTPKAGPTGGSVSEGEGFKIGVPIFDVSVKQGESETATIELKRGKNFKQDVTLEFKLSMDKGITLEPDKILVKASDQPEVQLTITADEEAAFGKYIVSVTGTPTTGEAALMEFNMKVVVP